MSITRSQRLKPWLARLALLALAPALALVLGACMLVLEYRTQYAARYIGAYLLRHNADRQPRGALWQGILASRRARLALADSSADLAPQSAPDPVLQHRYSLQHHGPHAVLLRVQRRQQSLQLDGPAPEVLRELARSLQVYERGRALLARAELPADPLYIHALIGAQIALEDGALFTQLHRRLLALDAVEAWTFLRMDTDEKAYWRTLLDPYLQAASTAADLEVAPVVRQALGEIVQSRQDSLRRDEIDRLLRCWDTVSGFEIRLNRGADQFAGYALLPGELPTAFSLPTPLVAEQLKLSDTAVGR